MAVSQIKMTKHQTLKVFLPNHAYGLPGYFVHSGDNSRKKPLGSQTNNENATEFDGDVMLFYM